MKSALQFSLGCRSYKMERKKRRRRRGERKIIIIIKHKGCQISLAILFRSCLVQVLDCQRSNRKGGISFRLIFLMESVIFLIKENKS